MDHDVAAARTRFLRDFPVAIEEDRAAVLAGAGLSVAAGFVNWRELLKTVADDLGLDIDQEWDLPGVAQYYLDGNNQDRSRLNQLLLDRFRPAHVQASPGHQVLVQLPIRDIWTTNYDECLEEAYRAAGKVVDVKRHNVPASWTSDRPDRHVVVYKIHGDTTDVGNVVLSRDDYDRYQRSYPQVLQALQTHMTQRSFLIVGFSLSDPNFDHVLSQLRSFYVENQRAHWLVLKAETGDLERRRQALRVRTLRRYGVETVLVEQYEDVPALLDELRQRLSRRNVLVSGSAGDHGLLPSPERSRIESLAAGVGRSIIATSHVLVSGLGLGIGSAVLTGAVDEVYALDADPNRRLVLRPFPRVGEDTTETVNRWRRELVRTAGTVVYLAGCKAGDDNAPVPADGVLAEFELATEQGGAWPLPIGATGWVARELHTRVLNDVAKYLPTGVPVDRLELLGDERATDTEILRALQDLLVWLRRQA